MFAHSREQDIWRNFHQLVDKCPTVRDLCDKLIWASQHLHHRMMKAKWKSRRKQWVRDCRSSTCTADFKMRCREFRQHVDWDAVDASVLRVANTVDTRGGGSETPRGAGGRFVKAKGKGAEDVGVAEGKGKSPDSAKPSETRESGSVHVGLGVGGAHASTAPQRPDKGISEMRDMVNRLVRRIHYSAFSCPSKDTWVEYHRSVGRSMTAAEVAERLVWAMQQLLPGMLRQAWVSRKQQW